MREYTGEQITKRERQNASLQKRVRQGEDRTGEERRGEGWRFISVFYLFH